MENVIRITELIEACFTAAGGMVAAWSIYQMISERGKDRPVDDKQWWSLLLGAFLAAMGMSGFISGLVQSIQF